MSKTEGQLFDATDEFQQYRLCLRDIWNRYLWAEPAFRDWDMVDHFDRVRPILMKNLLEEKLRRRGDIESHIPLELFIRPAVPDYQSGIGGAAIRISESNSKRGRDWNQPPSFISGSDMLLRFIDFFDWNQTSFRDLEYYLVEISHSDKYPELVGREALIETSDCEVLVGTSAVSRGIIMAAYERPAPAFVLTKTIKP